MINEKSDKLSDFEINSIILLKNKYIDIFDSVFNKCLKCKDDENIKKKIFGFVIKETIINQCKEEIDDLLYKFKENEFIRPVCTNDFRSPLNFDNLWQFCQFVRYAEKIIFFNNQPENILYVDSDMKDINNRRFRIKNKNNTIIDISLEKIKDKINNDTLKVLKIKVERQFGKKMVNTFTIVNDNIKAEDYSDIYLIFNLQFFILKEMENVFDNIINLAKETAFTFNNKYSQKFITDSQSIFKL